MVALFCFFSFKTDTCQLSLIFIDLPQQMCQFQEETAKALRRMQKVSIVIPCFNEEGNLQPLHKKIADLLGGEDFELLWVDDGSRDGTLEELRQIARSDQRVKYISLSRNFGHQNALKAGYDHASGDCIVCMDADNQHPAELVLEMIAKWREGYDVVYTVRREDKRLPWLKRQTSGLFYRLMNAFSDRKIPQASADFRLIDRKVADELRKLNENYLFFRGLIPWLGFKQYAIEYQPNERLSGQTKYSFKKMINFALAGVTSFSVKPLRISMVLGLVMAILAFAYGLYAISLYLFTEKAITGWASIMVSVLFIGGIQLMMLGIIGEYLGKLFIENKRRPNYIIREKN